MKEYLLIILMVLASVICSILCRQLIRSNEQIRRQIAEMEGKIRLGVPVVQAVPLLFDKDCRKLYKKLMRARSRLAARPPERSSAGTQNSTELAQAS